jgi:4a-hydroxytetrahydrobiopterin dehydratase
VYVLCLDRPYRVGIRRNAVKDLADRECVPCRGGVPPLSGERVEALLREVPGWAAPGGRHLERRYRVEDFAAALALANRIGEMAERQRHHPELCLGWGYVQVKVWTHKIDGLTESDFVFAAKCDRLA